MRSSHLKCSRFFIFSFGHTIVLKIEFDTGEDCHKIKRLFNKPESQITDKLYKTRITGNKIELLLFKLITVLKILWNSELFSAQHLNLHQFCLCIQAKQGLQQSKSDKALLC